MELHDSIALPREYTQIDTRYDARSGALWYYMKARPRPCFTPTLLSELRSFQDTIAQQVRTAERPVRYLIAGSRVPGVFNLGGDLDLFQRLIRAGDRDGLFAYARQCIDVLHANAVNLDCEVTTISLVQGSALGGGLEGAISSNVVIAERGADMGFPEILFNMFPGMGAYSLLARRIGMAAAERMILSGRLYKAEELYDMGVVDVLAEPGEGEIAVDQYIRQHSRARNGYEAVKKARQRYSPIDYEELFDIVSIWVDTALNIESKDLRMMERLVRAQDRRSSEGGHGNTDLRVA